MGGGVLCLGKLGEICDSAICLWTDSRESCQPSFRDVRIDCHQPALKPLLFEEAMLSACHRIASVSEFSLPAHQTQQPLLRQVLSDRDR